MSDPILVIGGGQAAAEAIATLRAKGETAPITLVGAEAWLPYERPPLSKAVLAGTQAPERCLLRKPSWYEDKQVTVHLGRRATAIDRAAHRVTLDDGSALDYGRLLLATGSDPRPLPVAGAELPGCHILRGLDDAIALGAALRGGAGPVAVIGAGYIGLEVAAVARKLGRAVGVIEALDRPLARVASAPFAAHVQALHRAQGVTFHFDARVTAIAGRDRAEGVVLSDGSQVAADLVVIGIGIRPNIALAEVAGIAVDNGILVDGACRTADPAIWAAGDCTAHPNPLLGIDRLRLESVHNAVAQGRVAALSMLGQTPSYAEVPWFWSDQFGVKLQMAGIADAADDTVTRGAVGGPRFAAFRLRDGRVTAVEAAGDMRAFVAGRKLIGTEARPDPAILADPDAELRALAPA